MYVRTCTSVLSASFYTCNAVLLLVPSAGMELDSPPPLESESPILPPPEGFGPPSLPVGDGSPPPLEAGSRPPPGDDPSLPEQVQYALDSVYPLYFHTGTPYYS